jgi:NADH:ubiquinone oxidoreductase subunit 5 (subunit L)/multisubunit Na+/H+ antiporter MnhA subunit
MLLATLVTLPLLSAMIALTLKERHVRTIELLSTFSMGIVLTLSVFAAYNVSSGSVVSSFSWLRLDSLSAIILTVIAFIGTNAMLYSSGYFTEEKEGLCER